MATAPTLLNPRSRHMPEFAGNIESVTGELVVESGLREIQTVTLNIVTSNFVANEESKVSWYQDETIAERRGAFIIRVEKGGSNDGVVGDSPVQISWMALGR